MKIGNLIEQPRIGRPAGEADRTRPAASVSGPAEAVTERKAWRIRRVTQVWMAEHRVRWCDTRFDVLAVLVPPDGRPVVQHYESAF